MRFGFLYSVALAASVVWPCMGIAATLQVPSEYSTIQLAIDAAVSGDTVLVGPGTYTEWRDSCFVYDGETCEQRTKAVVFLRNGIDVISVAGPESTFIDGQDVARGAYVGDRVDSLAFDGFTITGCRQNGTLSPINAGGGVLCWGRHDETLVIRDNHIVDNAAFSGAGIAVELFLAGGKSEPIIERNVIEYNHGVPGQYTREGSGLKFRCNANSYPIARYNIIRGNTVDTYGAGILVESSSRPRIVGNLLEANVGSGTFVFKIPRLLTQRARALVVRSTLKRARRPPHAALFL